MTPIRVGFVGAGNIARAVHYPSLAALPDVALVAACDLDQAKVDEVADKFDIPERFTDFDTMLATADMDAVYIVTPPKAVFPLAMAALEEGKHVFMEKPPGMTPEETEKMAEVAAANRCHTMVGFNRRFTPVLRAARDDVLTRGPVTSCAASYNKWQAGKTPAYGTDDWLLTDGLHALDTLRWLAASPLATVTSRAQRGGGGHFLRYAALLEFENGCLATYSGNYHCGARWERFEIHGDGVSAYVAAPDRAEVYVEDGYWATPTPQKVIEGKSLAGTDERRVTYGYEAEARHFMDVIRGERQPEGTLGDAAETMRLVFDIIGDS